MDIPEYTNVEYWDDLTNQFIQNPNKFVAWCNIEYYLLGYFKHCLMRGNRYFFQHPFIPLFKSVLSEHTVVLAKDTEVYRARIDEDHKLWKEWNKFSGVKNTPEVIKRIESRKGHNVDTKELWNSYNASVNSEEIRLIGERINAGFQGYDADGSTAPPSDKVSAGRCNLKGVSYLYVALEEHTAVAEIRPHIKDTVSIALLKPVRDLKLIDFDYEPGAVVEGKDFLFNDIQREYSLINKNRSDDYLLTQYLTALIEHLGYDGLCFRSSLVVDGTNYVIFNPDDCKVVSSKLCLLSKVNYEFGQCK